MKRIIISQALAINLFILIYLLGAFYEYSFDISKWADSTRFEISLFGGFASLIIIMIYLSNESENNDN